jgi:hypothetical protein
VRFTVASTAPVALAEEAKAPASTNIHTISSMFFCPAPLEKVVISSFRGLPLVRSMLIITIDMVMKISNICLD